MRYGDDPRFPTDDILAVGSVCSVGRSVGRSAGSGVQTVARMIEFLGTLSLPRFELVRKVLMAGASMPESRKLLRRSVLIRPPQLRPLLLNSPHQRPIQRRWSSDPFSG